MKVSFGKSKPEKNYYTYDEMLSMEGVYKINGDTFTDSKFVSLGQGDHLFLFPHGTGLETKYDSSILRNVWGHHHFTRLNESFTLHVNGD